MNPKILLDSNSLKTYHLYNYFLWHKEPETKLVSHSVHYNQIKATAISFYRDIFLKWLALEGFLLKNTKKNILFLFKLHKRKRKKENISRKILNQMIFELSVFKTLYLFHHFPLTNFDHNFEHNTKRLKWKKIFKNALTKIVKSWVLFWRHI